MILPNDILTKLRHHRQEHLVRHWDKLSEPDQDILLRQLTDLDLELVDHLLQLREAPHESGDSAAVRAARALPPQQLVRLPATDAQRAEQATAEQLGNELLRAGKVGAILVAGGQGSRLGFEAPKGMYPIGPVSQRTLFQILCEQVLARSRRAGATIPYFIMTSEATHARTLAFFEEHRYFGLGEDNVYFFQQSSLPAVDGGSHRILLEGHGRVATSPDGHGGMLRALQRTGMFDVMRDRGIEHLYYHQVDNPTAIVCDPVLLGYHMMMKSDLTTKVVAKVSPEERMGVLVDVDGQTQIIEYSDLPAQEAHRKSHDGNYVFWAGNTAIHVFRRAFLETLLSGDLRLPFHVAHKKVPFIDEGGLPCNPGAPNAHKFEQFIFDALPHAQRALVVEGDRAREFNPVKNAQGSDSPETSRAALNRIAQEWAQAAGASIGSGVNLEISPLFALDAAEARQKLRAGQSITTPTILGP